MSKEKLALVAFPKPRSVVDKKLTELHFLPISFWFCKLMLLYVWVCAVVSAQDHGVCIYVCVFNDTCIQK